MRLLLVEDSAADATVVLTGHDDDLFPREAAGARAQDDVTEVAEGRSVGAP